MATVGEVIEMINQKIHKRNFHVAKINMDLIPEGTNEENNTSHDLMAQTYDWRFAGKVDGIDLPSRDEVYHVDLTADNVAYIGRALEVYDRLHFEVRIKPMLEKMIKDVKC